MYNENKLFLSIVDDMELQVYLQGTDFGNIQGVIKGLLIYQGVSSSFWHCLGGSQQKLSQTFQKTKNVNIQLLLKSEPGLYIFSMLFLCVIKCLFFKSGSMIQGWNKAWSGVSLVLTFQSKHFMMKS